MAQYRSTESHSGASASRPTRRAWIWPLLAAVGLAAYAGLHSRMFMIRRVRVQGLVQLTSAQVLRAAGIPDGAYLWQVRPWNVARRVDLLPLVRHASVRLVWPREVVVAIQERLPVCLLRDGAQMVELDAHRRVIARESPAAVPSGLPVVVASGFSAKGLQPGQTLPEALAGDSAIEVALGLGVEGRARVASIAVDPVGQVTLQLRGGPTVRFGDGSQARRKTEELLGMLQVIQAQHLSVAEIDVASPSTPTMQLRSPPAKSSTPSRTQQPKPPATHG